jgi:hypothetical protein
LGGVTVTNNNTNTNTNTTDTSASNVSTQIKPAANVIVISASTTGNALPKSGATGDVVLTGSGATVVAGSRDEQSNSETAGFYGSNAAGGQEPLGVAAGLCRSRPWANNFLSTIVSTTFLDGLCKWRGYEVGIPTPAPVLTQTPAKPKIAPPVVLTIEPRADIWAVPPTVPLGARTTVFWNTQGVTSCTETSPDGSFNQNSLSGGAATVPLTDATTYTISCIAPDNSHITNYVTVNLKI